MSTKVSKTANTLAAIKAASDRSSRTAAETKHAVQAGDKDSKAFGFGGVEEGSAFVGKGVGWGTSVDAAPTQKTLQTDGFQEAEEPTGFKGKAMEVINRVGIKVAQSEFEAETAVKSKKVDADVIDKKGYDSGYQVLSAYAEGWGHVKVGKALNVEGEFETGALVGQSTLQAKKSLGATDLTGRAQASVGTIVRGDGQLRVDVFSRKPSVKVSAGVDAFVGAKATVDGRIGNDYAGAGGRVEVMAGLGAKAKVDVGLQKGRFQAKLELGAAVGIGGSMSVNVDVNFKNIGARAVELGKEALKSVGNATLNGMAERAQGLFR